AGRDGRLHHPVQLALVAAEELRDVAAFGASRQEVEARERAGLHAGAVRLDDGVLNQDRAEFREEPQDLVKLVVSRRALPEQVEGVLANLLVEVHVHLIARNISSSFGSVLGHRPLYTTLRTRAVVPSA